MPARLRLKPNTTLPATRPPRLNVTMPASPSDCRVDVARRALQQSRSEPFFEVLDGGGRDRARKAQVRRGGAEAATVDDADEEAERGQAVHSIVPVGKTMMPGIAA